ncbi:MAG: 3-hydroxyacyl-CoA dehydrogenase, partial [Betaproteobacteria bacterium]|nr:3-hydroxyacyl-CoA dehydrogenase [Betaproteobacteria bacterium]
QRELVDGGLLGRKSGQGFYRYPAGMPAWIPSSVEEPDWASRIVIHGTGPIADHLANELALKLAQAPERDVTSPWTGLAVDDARLVLSDGRSATELATVLNVPDVAVFDRFNIGHAHAGALALAYSTAECVSPRWKAQAQAWLVTLGFTPVELADVPGLIVTRTLAMLRAFAAPRVQMPP